MSKKQFTDKDGNTFVEVKPWYKRWWIWVIALMAIFLIIGLFGDSGNSSSSNTDKSKATGHSTTKTEKSPAKSASTSTISVDYDDYAVSSKKIYSTDFTDSTWPAAKLGVDKVTVYKLAKPYQYDSADDGKFSIQGFVRIHFTVLANRDLSIYPTQGTAVYNDGEQHECDSDETWDGDISKGVTKEGTATLPIEQLKTIGSLQSIRYKLDADYDTDNDDDDNDYKTYDFTLNLQ